MKKNALVLAGFACLSSLPFMGLAPKTHEAPKTHDELEPETVSQDQKTKDRLLLQSTQKGELVKVLALLHKGANPNAIDTSGKTAFHYAVSQGHKENVALVHALLQAKADPKIADKDGKTTLHLIADRERPIGSEVRGNEMFFIFKNNREMSIDTYKKQEENMYKMATLILDTFTKELMKNPNVINFLNNAKIFASDKKDLQLAEMIDDTFRNQLEETNF